MENITLNDFPQPYSFFIEGWFSASRKRQLRLPRESKKNAISRRLQRLVFDAPRFKTVVWGGSK